MVIKMPIARKQSSMGPRPVRGKNTGRGPMLQACAHGARMSMHKDSKARTGNVPWGGGFTLIEVVLALALASLVLYTVTLTVSLHLRVVDAGRTDVEEAVFARALLKQIADDLRGAVRYDPSAVDNAAFDSGVSSTDTDNEQSGDFPEQPRLEDDFGVEEDTEEGTESTQDFSQSTAPASVPGISGNDLQIQIDVARLPRPDQSQNASGDDDETAVADLLSDVKTVAYYVVTPGTVTAGAGLETRSGLIRRELDRAVTSYAADSGGLLGVELSLEPIAPEVKAIGFRYFDGLEWVDSWDTEDQGGLPPAVAVSIAIGRIRHETGGFGSWLGFGQQPEEDEKTIYYRLLVDLPAAAPTEVIEETLDDTDEFATDGNDAGERR